LYTSLLAEHGSGCVRDTASELLLMMTGPLAGMMPSAASYAVNPCNEHDVMHCFASKLRMTLPAQHANDWQTQLLHWHDMRLSIKTN
jgi:hypothetical protein